MTKKIINDLNIGELKSQYEKGKPFKYVVIDNFFKEEVAKELSNQFPKYDQNEIWNIYKNPLENKRTTPDWNLFPSETYRAFTYLNSQEFIKILENIIGIDNIIPDMGLHGGGWHITPSGGKLNVHMDYSIHPKLKLERRANLIIYLSEDWKPEYGGQLGLWSHDEETNSPKECVSKIDVKFNRAVIFDTTQNSWHGLPEEITSPKGINRKSLAIYYLTEPRIDISSRERAYFAPYKDQAKNPEIMELIKKRANSQTIGQAYRTE